MRRLLIALAALLWLTHSTLAFAVTVQVSTVNQFYQAVQGTLGGTRARGDVIEVMNDLDTGDSFGLFLWSMPAPTGSSGYVTVRSTNPAAPVKINGVNINNLPHYKFQDIVFYIELPRKNSAIAVRDSDDVVFENVVAYLSALEGTSGFAGAITNSTNVTVNNIDMVNYGSGWLFNDTCTNCVLSNFDLHDFISDGIVFATINNAATNAGDNVKVLRGRIHKPKFWDFSPEEPAHPDAAQHSDTGGNQGVLFEDVLIYLDGGDTAGAQGFFGNPTMDKTTVRYVGLADVGYQGVTVGTGGNADHSVGLTIDKIWGAAYTGHLDNTPPPDGPNQLQPWVLVKDADNVLIRDTQVRGGVITANVTLDPAGNANVDPGPFANAGAVQTAMEAWFSGLGRTAGNQGSLHGWTLAGGGGGGGSTPGKARVKLRILH